MASEVKAWSKLYDMTKQSILKKRSTGEYFNQAETNEILKSMQSLESQLRLFSNTPENYDLDASEVARRQVLLFNTRKMLESAQPPTNPNDTRNQPGMMSDGGLIQRQKDIVGLQDDMIQEISFGLDRVHHQALNMGEEVTSQTKLLDGFNEDVELATAALQAETRHTEKIKQHTKMCYYYVCIGAEVVIIVLLLIVLYAV